MLRKVYLVNFSFLSESEAIFSSLNVVKSTLKQNCTNNCFRKDAKPLVTDLVLLLFLCAMPIRNPQQGWRNLWKFGSYKKYKYYNVSSQSQLVKKPLPETLKITRMVKKWMGRIPTVPIGSAAPCQPGHAALHILHHLRVPK